MLSPSRARPRGTLVKGPSVRIVTCADTAIVVEFGDAVDRRVNDRVLAANDAIARAGLRGVVETVPTFRSLMIHYDPLLTSSAALTAAIESALDGDGGQRQAPRRWLVPVCYEDARAPDLADVARRAGLTRDAVIACHVGRAYHVYMIGFLPGYPYMGDLDAAIRLPRRETPRTRLPAGSVAIATSMTAIYPYQSPGGWHLIGSTPAPIFDPGAMPPARFAAGDTVAFEPIASKAFDEIQAAAAEGSYVLAPVEAAS